RDLLAHPLGATPVTYALAALMCLHAARLPARVDTMGNMSSLFDQDRSRWDPELLSEGRRFLNLSASGPELTAYHTSWQPSRLPGIRWNGESSNNVWTRAKGIPELPLDFGMPETRDEMVIHQARRLHVGITDGRADESETARLQFLAHVVGFRRSRGYV